MGRLTRDGMAEPVSRGQILRHARGKGNVHFPRSADHEQDWQPYPVHPYSAIYDIHTYIHTYCTLTLIAMHQADVLYINRSGLNIPILILKKNLTASRLSEHHT